MLLRIREKSPAEAGLLGVSVQGLGTMAHVGLLDMSASIAGVKTRHFAYVDPASAIPPLNADANIARALAAYPPDHAGYPATTIPGWQVSPGKLAWKISRQDV